MYTTLTIRRAIADTKLKFSLVMLVLAGVIVIGSFYLIGYLNFAIIRQGLFLSALRYRAEYIAQTQNVNLLAAAQSALSAASIFPGATSTPAEGVPVLTYHSVLPNKQDVPDPNASDFEGANVSLTNFKEQMFALKAAGWQTVSYADFDAFVHGQKLLPAKSFLLTFDDGAKNSFYPADPILAALDFQATAFILPAHSLGDRSTYYLNRNELDLMLSTRRWTIESHGQNVHVSLPTDADGSTKDNALSNRIWVPDVGRLETHAEYASRIQGDLSDAKDNLENAFHVDVNGFAFPFGDYGQNASNDPDAEATILAAAHQSYSLAFYQNWNKGNFTFNYPNPNAFLVKRIPVGAAWTAQDLLDTLDAASPKSLPYIASTTRESGWDSDWGISTEEDGGLRMSAGTSTTGALTVLDGTYTWKDYDVEMPVSWESGYVMVLFDLQSEKIGRSCVFSDKGVVQLQERTADDILILRESVHKEVKPGEHTIGAVTVGDTTACVFDGQYVIDATLPPASGGVGFEAWAQENGTASALIKGISVAKE